MAEHSTETLHVEPADAGVRLDRWLARALAVPIDHARTLVHAGRVRIRGKTCAISRKLFGGEDVVVERREPKRRLVPESAGPQLSVLYDDARCLVVDKPAGLAVEPSVRGAPSVCGAAARMGVFAVQGRAWPGLAHRLDAGTTGCLLLARDDRALAALRGAFETGVVEKDYLVLVAGAPPDEGRLDTPYARDPADARRFTTRVPSPRRARLSFTKERRLPGAALLRVRLETGRTHQIRVQLADAGYPVLGDTVYGVASDALPRQALHAERLAFPRPHDGARVVVRAPLPDDLRSAVERLAALPGGGES